MRNKAIDKVKYRGKKIRIYADDCGQSFYFIYKGKYYSCGTYNPDYLAEIIDIVDTDLDHKFYVSALPTLPSAKVYQRYGVWYYDYKDYKNLFLDYGELIPKKNRSTIEQLKEEVIKRITKFEQLDDEDRENVN